MKNKRNCRRNGIIREYERKSKLLTGTGGKRRVLCLTALLLATVTVAAAIITAVGADGAAAAGAATPGLYDYGDGVNRLADGDTHDSYQSIFNFDESSRYAGRVWSDKSVFASKGEPDGLTPAQILLNDATDGYGGTDGTPVTSAADFLHVFSALGSSIFSESYVPLDVVFVLDVSNSMKNFPPNSSTTRIRYAIDGLNDCIDMLMNEGSPYNRVAVVAFNGNRQDDSYGAGEGVTLLNLGRYNKGTGTGAAAATYFGLTEGDLKDEKNGVKTANVYTVAQETGEGSRGRANVTVEGATNTQIAMYKGMRILAENGDTSVDYNGDGIPEKRQPIVVLLSDGQPTIASGPVSGRGSTVTVTSWWQPGNSRLSDGGQSYFGNGMLAAAVSSYMKNEITENYGIGAMVYTFGIDIHGLAADTPNADESVATSTKAADALAAVTLNPGKELEKVAYKRATGSELYPDEPATLIAGQVYDAWLEYIGSDNTGTPTIQVSGYNYTYRDVVWTDTGLYGGTRIDNVIMPHPTTGKDIDTLDYVTKFYDVPGVDLPEKMRQMVEEFLDYAFTPISGMNNVGIEDALTYFDPVGEYMEIKNGAVSYGNVSGTDMAMLLFGTMYRVERTGFYDAHAQSGSVSESEVSAFVPSFAASSAVKKQNTVYFLYKISGVNESELTKWRFNPAYVGRVGGITEDDYINNYIFIDSKQAEYNALAAAGDTLPNGVYRLSDIRIWVEDTGDYVDENDTDFFVGSGFDQALYMSVPSNAIPVRIVDVTVNRQNSALKDYDTNMGNTRISTPIRLFYSVGVQDEIRGGSGVDLTKVSQTYIDSHVESRAEGGVYFLSNYFTADGVDKNVEGGRLKGDPAVTFSPSGSNRYYIYQKTLLLYSKVYQLQSGAWTPVNDLSDLSEVEERIMRGVFDELPDPAGYGEGEVVFLSEDWVTENIVETESYFIAIDYFVPDGSKHANVEQYVIGRSGAEFAGQITSDGQYSILPGDMLCWLDLQSGTTVTYESGCPGDGWYLTTKIGGLRCGSLEQSWTEKKAGENPTDTAGNVYMPVISNSTQGYDDGTSGGGSGNTGSGSGGNTGSTENPYTDNVARTVSLTASSNLGLYDGSSFSGLNDGATDTGDKTHYWRPNLGSRDSTVWVQYTWDDYVTVNRISVIWFTSTGVTPPTGAALEYMDRSGAWVPVSNPSPANVGRAEGSDNPNVMTFDPVVTTALRLNLTRDGSNGLGIRDWSVFGYVTPVMMPDIENVARTVGVNPTSPWNSQLRSDIRGLNDGIVNGSDNSYWRPVLGFDSYAYVMYTWSESVVVSSIDIYWFSTDGSSVPSSAELDYWDGSGWQTISGNIGTRAGGYNTLSFDPVETISLLLTVYRNSSGTIGISEWRVNGYAASAVIYPDPAPVPGAGTVPEPSGPSAETISPMDALINVHLGNNGKLAVESTEVMATKLVGGENVDDAVKHNQPFTYQIYIEGMTGIHNAIKVRWDEDLRLWYRVISYIDVITDNGGYIMNSDGERITVDALGNLLSSVPVPEDGEGEGEDPPTAYFVYLGGEASDDGANVVRVYDESGSGSGSEDRDRVNKKLVYYSGAVTLVPVSGEGDQITKSSFKIAELEIEDHGGRRSGVTFRSDFSVRMQYSTVSLYFGAKDWPNGQYEPGTEPDAGADFGAFTSDVYDGDSFRVDGRTVTIEDVIPNTAEFTLRHGEGLVFTGLVSGTRYRVTEKLTAADYKNGWRLWKDNEKLTQQNIDSTPDVAVRHVQQNEFTNYEADAASASGAKITDHASKISDGSYSVTSGQSLGNVQNSAHFDGEKKDGDNKAPYYSVYGSTGAREEAVQFLNTYFSTYMEISKTVIDTTHAADGDRYFFRIELYDAMNNPLMPGTYHAYIHPLGHDCDPVGGHPHTENCRSDLTFVLGEHGEDDVDTGIEPGTPVGYATVELHDGEAVVITGLPQGAHYYVREMGWTDLNGYTYDTSIDVSGETEWFGGRVYQGQLWIDGELNEGDTEYDPDIPGVHVAYKNAVVLHKHYNLTLTKTVTGNSGDTEYDWTFTVKLTPPADIAVEFPNELAYVGHVGKEDGMMALERHEDGTGVYYTGTVTLRHGETLTLLNLPEGTRYEIIEAEANQKGYVTKIKLKDAEGTVGSELNAGGFDGVLAADVFAEFVNDLSTGSLDIEKQVRDEHTGAGERFTFRVTLRNMGDAVTGDTVAFPCEYSDGSVGTVRFTGSEDGSYTAEIRLRRGERITIYQLPYGTTFEVVETAADGYVLDAIKKLSGEVTPDFAGKRATGSITAEETAAGVQFINAPKTDLPGTGGAGVDPMLSVGTAITAAGAVLCLFMRKKKKHSA